MKEKNTDYSMPRLKKWTIKHKISCRALTNEIFLTTSNHFLKVSRFTSEPIIDRQNEVKIWKFLQQKQFSDTILPKAWGYLDDGRFYSVYRYLPNITPVNLQHPTAAITTQLQAIKTILKRLHSISVNQCSITPFNPVQFFYKIKNKIKIPIPFNLAETTTILNWVSNYKFKKWVLCHSDLVLANLVWSNKRLMLIDFEYAFLNDPLYDVASLIAEGLVDQHQVQKWLTIWNLTSQAQKIVWYWTQYQNLKNVLWAWFMWQSTNQPVYQQIAQQQYKLLKKPLFMV